MQCEFSKDELIRLNLSVLGRVGETRKYLGTRYDDALLRENIKELEKLRTKLEDLIRTPETVD